MENIEAGPAGSTQPDLHALQRLRAGVPTTSILLHSTVLKHPGPSASVVAVSTERNKTK